jgi:hypothetical protein
MKKLMSVVMILVLAFAMCGCAFSGTGSKKRNIDLEKVRQHKGVLLEVTSHPQGPMTQEDVERYTNTQKVTYDGCAYNPFNTMGIKMTDEDFLFIYEFCLDAYEKGLYKDYSEKVDDGMTFTFVYYDENGEAHVLYDGYCYDNKTLNKVRDIIGKYSLD